MSQAQAQRFNKAGYVTVRKGNRKATAEHAIQGRRYLPIFIISLIFVAFASVFTWSNHQSVQLGYSIADLHKEHNSLLEKNRQLKFELANLTSPARLEEVSRSALGLTAPQPHQVQVIE